MPTNSLLAPLLYPHLTDLHQSLSQMPIPPRAVCLSNPTQCAAIGLALEMLPGVSKDSEALNVATYFFREVWSSIGLFRGVHTGSPTNKRIACAASIRIRAAACHAAGHLATGPVFMVLYKTEIAHLTILGI